MNDLSNLIVDIEKIDEGDKVFVWDEKSNSIKRSKVKAKVFSGNKDVYRIKAGGREIEATENHPFLSLSREKNKLTHKKAFFKHVWSPLGTLKKGDMVALAKELPQEGTSFTLPKISKNDIVKSKNQYSKFEMNL